MKRHLKFKPGFDRTVERFEAWWEQQIVDRPPVTLQVKPTQEANLPASGHASVYDWWRDVEYQVGRQIALLESQHFLADTLPVLWPNVGPDLTGCLFGCEIQYLNQTTGWSEPVVHGMDDWHQILTKQPDFACAAWRAMEAMTTLAIEKAEDRYLVGLTDLHGNYDILSALRDPQALCMDVMDCPELLKQVGTHVSQGFVQAFERQWDQVSQTGYGSTTWCPVYHEGPCYLPSCDFWCMVSPEDACQLILPTIEAEMKPMSRSLFHLDGPEALRHLDLLLELPDLDAIQWIYGEGNGPACRWIDVYKKIQKAGKSFQLNARDPADALEVLAQMSPEGMWLNIMGKPFESVEEAQAFIEAVSRQCA